MMGQPLVLDVPSVGALERAIDQSGLPLAALMERAGMAVAATALECLRDVPEPCAVVLAGSGNNGGDGWIAAAGLAREGCATTLVTPKSAEALSAEPAHQWAGEIAAYDEPMLRIVVAPDDAKLVELLSRADLVVDALLGTGFAGTTVRAPFGRWIELLNDERIRRASEAPGRPLIVVAVDVPSGVSAQSGAAANPSVMADDTITMLTAKPGLLMEEAREHVGRLTVDDLGVDVVDYLDPVIFRQGVPDDLDGLLEFYRMMIAATTGTDNDPRWNLGLHPSRESLAASLAAREIIVGVAVATGGIVAAAVVDRDWNEGYRAGAWQSEVADDEAWTLHLVAVDPHYQHRGYGRELVERAEACARDRGGRVMRIDVLGTNEPSMITYERLGYTRIGPVHLTYDDPQVSDFVLFEKPL